MGLDRKEAIKALEKFKELRDALLHEDDSELEFHLKRFVEYINSNELVQSVLGPILVSSEIDVDNWWSETIERASSLRGPEVLIFPKNGDDELAVRYWLMQEFSSGTPIHQFGSVINTHKDWNSRFLSLIVRPFVKEITVKLGEASHLTSLEERDLQAVPLSRLPSEKESKIFLSHKSIDKPIVEMYFRVLSELGYSPWLDDPEMPAGTNLERALLDGFEKSCAAVFFVTENFKDENYLATEVDYAIRQKRNKDLRFSIITLLFGDNATVPKLLESYIYKPISNDAEGLYEIIRALPVELGPIRWKEYIIE